MRISLRTLVNQEGWAYLRLIEVSMNIFKGIFMTTAFEVDINTIANSFSTMVPIVEGTYDLTPDAILLEQEQHESDVRSYPRRLPIAIKRACGALVEDTRGQLFLDCLAGAGTLSLGYNHPEINQALKDQLDSGLPYQTLDITI
jgi:diaminobutyrate-2-oxoglutarate transaminase/L-2,4-diaminobutyrate decarboxylase